MDSKRKKGPGLSCQLWKDFGHPALNECEQKVVDPSLSPCIIYPVNAIHKRIHMLIFQNNIPTALVLQGIYALTIRVL